MASNSVLIDSHFQHYKTLIDDIFKELHNLTVNLHNEKLAVTVDDIRSRLNEPFLFVIVGEVKVGKSSFVNALLQTDKEVCKVAPDPCTDTIQQIVYSETEAIIPINDYFKKITLPIEILKKIAIVDTPGTNAVIKDHTEITERFIPTSDLVIFVFEAKNPYRQSAWDFFDYISKEWRKKVIFVLQQCDLIDEADLKVNIEGVKRYAGQRGVSEPKIFCVSAKLEQKGQTEESGFHSIRDFVRDSITGGGNMRMKIQSLLDTSRNIMGTIKEGLALRSKQMEIDEEFRHKVNRLLNGAEIKTSGQIDNMLDEVLREYDKITGEIQEEFEDGLGLARLVKKSFLSIFNEKESLKEWIATISQKIEVRLRPALERKMRDGVVNIADSVKQMAEIIDIEIQKSKKPIMSNNQVFGAIASRRQDKLDKLHANIVELTAEAEAFVSNDALRKSSNLVPNLAAGGGLAVVGGILAYIAQASIFDVTGGVLAGIGLLGGGLYTMTKRNQIIKEFADELYRGRTRLKDEINEKLSQYVKEIRIKIDNNFLEFDSFLNNEQENLEKLQTQYDNIDEKFENLTKELEL